MVAILTEAPYHNTIYYIITHAISYISKISLAGTDPGVSMNLLWGETGVAGRKTHLSNLVIIYHLVCEHRGSNTERRKKKPVLTTQPA